MNRFLKTKAWLMILLSVSIPLFSVSLAAQPVAAVQDAPGVGEDPEVIGVQCEGKADAGQSFIDFMDNGAVKTIEAAAAILFAISAIINLVDTVLDAISLIFGHTDCCWSIIGEAGVCQGLSGVWKAWGNIKGFYPLLIANALGTCACCNGGKPAGDICGSAITMPAGIEIDAFESIYTAVACLCPVAIMFNLRKLKTIYQVHNCCVKQACKAGQSIEACERMLDESTCMYFEGALMKAIVGIVIKLVANFIVSQVKEWLKKNIGEKTMTCFFIFYNAINIPGRIQAVMAAKEWVSDTFSEPDCEALGFEESDNRLGSNSKSDSEAIEAMTNSIASREQRQVTDPKKPTTGGETIVSRAQTKTEGEAINSGSSGSKVVYTPVGEAYQNGRLLNLQPSTDDDFSYTRTDSRTNLPYPGKYYVTSDGVTHYTGGTNDRGTYESQSLPPDAMPGS
ncbi:MAG: hypothetical protein Q7S65_06055, partial [Nanoarchaeota archaeon]|nr:hypothetical protein [Nanoarchaeota archaeon]